MVSLINRKLKSKVHGKKESFEYHENSIVSSQTKETLGINIWYSAIIHVLQYNGEKRRLIIHWPLVLLAKFWHARYLTNEILWNVEQK